MLSYEALKAQLSARIAELEAELARRDKRIAELEATVARLEATAEVRRILDPGPRL